jgi:hypothetical protein
MTRGSKIWLGVGVLYFGINLGGAGIAAAEGELMHAGVHAALLLLGAFVVWLAPSRLMRRFGRGADQEIAVHAGEFSDRLSRLENTVDAVAIEAERIGEAQRFMTRVLTEKELPRP